MFYRKGTSYPCSLSIFIFHKYKMLAGCSASLKTSLCSKTMNCGIIRQILKPPFRCQNWLWSSLWKCLFSLSHTITIITTPVGCAPLLPMLQLITSRQEEDTALSERVLRGSSSISQVQFVVKIYFIFRIASSAVTHFATCGTDRGCLLSSCSIM